MSTPVIPLSEGFVPATRQDWIALVEKTLKGSGPDSITTTTPDGLTVRPLYTADTATPPVLTAAARQTGGWDVRARVDAPSPAAANRQTLDNLAGGAASVLIKLSDGDAGVRIASAEDLALVLEGVMTDIAPVALDAGFLGTLAADWLARAAKASPASPLAFHLDPLTAFARTGVSPGPIDAHVAAAAAQAVKLAETYPKATLFLASGQATHEAGGSAPWEIATAASAAVTYAKALVAAGLDTQAAFSGIVLALTVDADPLVSIAKLRAGRAVWNRITAATGVSAAARIEARSSSRMITVADRWTNLVRLTAAGFAGAVGGAEAVVLGGHADAIDSQDELGRRMARNTQLVLMEEARLGEVSDPAGGSWAVETLTADLAQAAWSAFQTLEAAGGLAAALSAGIVAQAVARSRQDLTAAIAERRLKIVGVTDFKPEETLPEAPAADRTFSAPVVALPGADSVCPALAPIRLEALA